MLPQGMFSVAVATVLFPSLVAPRVARRHRRLPAARSSLGLRQIAFLLVPASVVCAVLAEPIVRLLYQRGAFTPAQTPVVAGALAAFCARARLQRDDADAEPRVLQPAVELDPDARRARRTSALNAVLDARLLPLGVWGIPLATSLVNIAGTAALLVLLRRRLGRLELARRPRSTLPDRRARRRRSPPSPTASGGRSTTVLGRSLAGPDRLARLPRSPRRRVYLAGVPRARGCASSSALLALRRRRPAPPI